MLNVDTSSSPVRWQPTPGSSTLKRPQEGKWSTFQDVLKLLHFEEPVQNAGDGGLFRHHRYPAGQRVLRAGQPFDGLYVVRFGALKTSMTHADGGEHVLAFPMKGDLLGFDGTCKHHYLSEVVALTDCELIRIPAAELFPGGRGCSDIERVAFWAISREVVQEQTAYALSHSAKSEARVARFLRVQSERFAALGYSPLRFTLPMTRRDIGNHLDVTLETVSRAFSTLDHLGIIAIERRDVCILSLEALRDFEGQ
jgi:CRP/FNR family transcriptional regulator, anaerobic regulatory protein